MHNKAAGMLIALIVLLTFGAVLLASFSKQPKEKHDASFEQAIQRPEFGTSFDQPNDYHSDNIASGATCNDMSLHQRGTQ